MKILRTTYQGYARFTVVLDGCADDHEATLKQIEEDVRDLIEHAPGVMKVHSAHIEDGEGVWEDGEF